MGPPGAGLPGRRGRFRSGQRSGDLASNRAAPRGTQRTRVGLHSGPVSSAVPEAPGGLTHRTSGSPHSGHTNKTGHQLEHPHDSHAQHPVPHLRSPARHVTHRQPSVTPSVHMQILHMSLDFTTHSAHFTPRTPRAGKLCLSRPLHSHAASRGHVPPSTHQPPSCSCEAAPFPCRANKRLFLPALMKKGRLSRSGRAGRSQQAAQHCSLVPPGGPGRGRPLCRAPLQRLSPIPLTPSTLSS